MILYFEIPGFCQPKERARTGRWGGKTPDRTKRYEAKVKILAQHSASKAKWKTITKGQAVELTVGVFVAMPKSWSKKKKAEHLGMPCLNTTDLSNCLKSIEDGINHTTIWDDDRLVASYGKLTGMYWANQEDEKAIVKIKQIFPQPISTKDFYEKIKG